MLPRFLSLPIGISLALTVSARSDVFYAPDSAGDAIKRVNAIGAASTVISTGLSDPSQVVVEASGDILVADTGLGRVMRYPVGGGSPVQVGDDVPGVGSLAFSPGGVLYVASTTNGTIQKLNANETDFELVTTIAAATLRGIAFDSKTGDLYIADQTGNRILIIEANETIATDYATAVTAPFALAFDSAGKLHFTDARDGGRIGYFQGNPKNPNGSKEVVKNLGAVRGFVFDRADVPHYLLATGELRKVVGTGTTSVTTGLGGVQHLTSRATQVTSIAHSTQSILSPTPVVISKLGNPAIGGGSTALKVNLASGPNATSANNLALLRKDSEGNLEVLARKSLAAPNDTIPRVISNIGDPILNRSGRVAFIGTLRPNVDGVTSVNSIRIFSDFDGGPLRSILKRGDSAPGPDFTADVKFTAFKQMVLPDGVGPAIIATIAGPGVKSSDNLGVWASDAAGTFSLVLRKGQEIATTDKPRKLGSFKLFTSTAMSLGQARHFGDAQTFTVQAKCTDGYPVILRVKPGMAPEILAEKGSDVAALVGVAGAKLASFNSPAMADDAFAAYKGALVATGGITSATAQIIIGRDAANTKIARTGDSAPGTDSAFASLGDPVVNPDGNLAFFAKLNPKVGTVTSATLAGLWQDLGSGVTKAVRQGDSPQGVSGSMRFTAFKQYILPTIGGVTFTGTIAGDGITSANNLGIWTNDGAGSTEPLLRKGDRVFIGGKDRIVTSFKVFTTAVGATGQSRQFDANGSVVCQVGCSDGTKAILKLTPP